LKLNELLTQRAAAFDTFKALAEKPELTAEEQTAYTAAKTSVDGLDDQIKRARELQIASAATAQPVAGQEVHRAVPASPETDPYVNDEAAKKLARTRGVMEGSARSLVVGAMVKTLAAGNGSIFTARQVAQELYGENHPVTRALVVSTGTAGGFIVPPDYMAEIIELLRPRAVVRSAGPRTIPMPRGTMRIPGQASAATASYGSETQKISASQQSLNSIVASYKKLTALVPVSNDMMRYSDPAVDAFVRDDLVKVLALREDLAFLFGDGTQDTPRGYLSFANGWVAAGGGTVGNWLTTGNSTEAVNGADPAGSTGGNFITSTETFTADTVADELGGAINRLDSANVPDSKRVWFMSPRSKNYLFNARNSLTLYIWRDEMVDGTLLGYPFKISNQIANNYYDGNGAHTDCSFVFLAEMDETMILDSMQLELAVSREASYIDANGNTVSAFQNDQTLIRAVEEHDFQLRHDASVAIIQRVRWAPAIG
jgi:HK97 family phage major capsid protein